MANVIERTKWSWPKGMLGQTKLSMSCVLWTLYLHGPVNDPQSGRATRMLGELMHAAKTPWRPTLGSSSQLTGLFTELESPTFHRSLRRTANARRTQRIEYVLTLDWLPPMPLDFPLDFAGWKPDRVAAVRELYGLSMNGGPTEPEPIPEPEPEPEPIPEPDVDETDPVPDPEPVAVETEPVRFDGYVRGRNASDEPETITAPATTIDDELTPLDLLLFAQQLTTEAILRFAEMANHAEQRIARASEPTVDNEMAERLAMALEETTRLRKRVREAEDAAAARKMEAETVRKALRQTQANLDALRNGSAVNDTGFKALRRMMTEKPRGTDR